ncbi:glycosyltransferase [[Enterobacter] lignolyticus]|uniref:Glycosyl transferase family 2 n=1 Tax=Enterobacter lignolyticus (strain SCF1) TaxID=701347 RepID=E3GCY6_ENTLS|nr:glycosyltransferase [[Enterobacter] lignolyticus]ADO47916.1 glycosyl transferase family 2 [[Enterobacter] lignolyticus SCF1]
MMKAKIKNTLRPIYYKMSPKSRDRVKKAYQFARGIKLDDPSAESESKIQPVVRGDISCLHQMKRSKDGHDLLIFPVIDWEFRVQRPQHLARELGALGSRVIYFTTTFHVSTHPGFSIVRSPCENVVICKLHINDNNVNIYKDKLSDKQIAFLTQGVCLARQAFGFGYTSSIINLPFWRKVAESCSSNHIIYDCMDHHAGFENNDPDMLREEETLLKSSDLVVTTAQRLSETISEHRENVIIRNGCEVEFFSRKTSLHFIEKKRPVVGYYGAIAEWFDLDLLIEAANAYPNYDFVMIGAETCDVSLAKKVENIHFLGEIPYEQLTSYLQDFDVCLIPFKLIELTLCTNPVKVYEYLAAGKPVVCTAMPEVKAINDVVHVADSSMEFIELINVAMDESKNDKLCDARKAWAKNHDWRSRAQQLLNEIIKLDIKKPKVSIIVLTFNNLHLTKECLFSIERNTEYDNYEVIIVDNLSTDNTRAYLQQHYEGKKGYKVILNDDNVGFAAGNNVGLEYATGQILVVLNNDTYVSPFWLGALVKAFKRYPDMGLLGPVTNNIGNESKIKISYQSWSEMQVKSLRYITSHANEIYPMACLAFFCAAMRREVYEKVGGLSLDYGLGFFEDDDYCKRVDQAGWGMAAVEDSFVHHHLSASFNKLKNNQKELLMQKNQAVFESKWGKWKPHSYRPGVY